jgi:hypothetical protein
MKIKIPIVEGTTGRAQADSVNQTSGIVTGDAATTAKMDSPCNWICPPDASGQEGFKNSRKKEDKINEEIWIILRGL